ALPITVSATGRYAKVASDGAVSFITWTDGRTLFGARLSQAGALLDQSPLALGESLGLQLLNGAGVFDGSNFVAFWSAGSGAVRSAFGARVSGAGALVDAQPFQVSGPTPLLAKAPLAASRDGAGALLLWPAARDGGADLLGAYVEGGRSHGEFLVARGSP